jgi:hypothetical protein
MSVGTAARTRAELVREQALRPPFGGRMFAPDERPVRAGITGTGPSLLLLAWSESDLGRERAAGARLFRQLGIEAGMRVANALPGALATPGALIVGDVNEELGALDVPVGDVATPAAASAAWELIDRVEVGVVILDPARATMFLAAAPALERPWWRGIVWLETPGAPAERPAAPAFGGWQRRWLAVPEVSSFVAGECAAARLHVNPAFAPAVEGGELVLGPLHPGVPWRYRTTYAARALGACGCGSADPVLS